MRHIGLATGVTLLLTVGCHEPAAPYALPVSFAATPRASAGDELQVTVSGGEGLVHVTGALTTMDCGPLGGMAKRREQTLQVLVGPARLGDACGAGAVHWDYGADVVGLPPGRYTVSVGYYTGTQTVGYPPQVVEVR